MCSKVSLFSYGSKFVFILSCHSPRRTAWLPAWPKSIRVPNEAALIYFDRRKIGILSYQFSPRNIPLFVTRARRLVSHRIFGAFPPFRSTQGARTRHLRCTLAQLDASTALNQCCTKATCKLTTFIVVKRTLKSLGFFSEIKLGKKKVPENIFLWVRL